MDQGRLVRICVGVCMYVGMYVPKYVYVMLDRSPNQGTLVPKNEYLGMYTKEGKESDKSDGRERSNEQSLEERGMRNLQSQVAQPLLVNQYPSTQQQAMPHRERGCQLILLPVHD